MKDGRTVSRKYSKTSQRYSTERRPVLLEKTKEIHERNDQAKAQGKVFGARLSHLHAKASFLSLDFCPLRRARPLVHVNSGVASTSKLKLGIKRLAFQAKSFANSIHRVEKDQARVGLHLEYTTFSYM